MQNSDPDERESVQRYLHLVLKETVQAHSQRLRFTAEPDRIVVAYDNGGDWVERDHPPIRLWHTLLAALHSLIGNKLIHLGPTGPETVSPPINTVVLDMTTDDLGRGSPCATINACFSQTEVILEFVGRP